MIDFNRYFERAHIYYLTDYMTTQRLTITVSVDAVIDRTYAMAALRSVTEDPDIRLMPLLTESERNALVLLVNDAYSQLLLRLLPYVAEATAPSDAERPMELTLLTGIEADGGVAIAVSRRIEHILAVMTLSLVLAVRSGALSSAYDDEAMQLIDTFRNVIGRSTVAASRLTACWI